MGALEASELATEVMYEVSKVQSKYWKSIDIKTCEPPEGKVSLSFIITANVMKKSLMRMGSHQSSLYRVRSVDDHLVDAEGCQDLLKIHRAHHMFTKHGLFQIPLASAELEAAFAGQIICR